MAEVKPIHVALGIGGAAMAGSIAYLIWKGKRVVTTDVPPPAKDRLPMGVEDSVGLERTVRTAGDLGLMSTAGSEKVTKAIELAGEASDLKSDVDDIKAVLLETEATIQALREQGLSDEAAKLQSKASVLEKEAERNEAAYEEKLKLAEKALADAVNEMNIKAYANMSEVVEWIQLHDKREEHPSALDTWLHAHLEALPRTARIRKMMGIPEDWRFWSEETFKILLKGGYGVGLWVQEYGDAAVKINDWMTTEKANAERAVRNDAKNQNYTDAVFFAGYWDFIDEVQPAWVDWMDRIAGEPTWIPAGAAGLHALIDGLMKWIPVNSKIEIPMSKGPASPVQIFWNEGKWPQAVYFAGRWQAAKNLHEKFFTGPFFLPGRPFWGDPNSPYYQKS